MSGFISDKFDGLTPYVPGEQPRVKLIKLNTNESPFPPSPFAQKMAREAAGDIQLYSDTDTKKLRAIAADKFGIGEENIVFSNGSDEILDFAIKAYCDEKTPAVFPDVTYGFYPVFCESNGVPYREIPLKEDMTIAPEAYFDARSTVVIANPNAQTGVALPLADVERIVKENPRNVVIIDEAYVDFGGESAIGLTKKYENLLVVGTFSKSRSLAGARLGFAIGNAELIKDLNKLRYSFNPYNVNKMTEAAGIGALIDETYFKKNCKAIMENRDYLTEELKALGFDVLPSSANFVLCSHKERAGAELHAALREKGILVRRFDMPRIKDHLRITIGSKEELSTLVAALKEIL